MNKGNLNNAFVDPSTSPQTSSWISQSPNNKSTSPQLGSNPCLSPSNSSQKRQFMNANSPPFLPSSSLMDSFSSSNTTAGANANNNPSSILLNDSIDNHLSGVFQSSLHLNSNSKNNNHTSPSSRHYNFLNDPLFPANPTSSASSSQPQPVSMINSDPLSNVAPNSYFSSNSANATSTSSHSSTHSSFDNTSLNNSFIPQPLSNNQPQMSPNGNNQQSSSASAFSFPPPFELPRRYSFNADLFINNPSSSPSNIAVPTPSSSSENNIAAANSSSSSSSTSINNNQLIPPMLGTSASTSSIPLMKNANNSGASTDSNGVNPTNSNGTNASLLDSTIDENIAFSVASSLSQQLDELDPTSNPQQSRSQQQQQQQQQQPSTVSTSSRGLSGSHSITTTTLTYRSSFGDPSSGNPSSLLNPPSTAPLNSYQSMSFSMASALSQQRSHHPHINLQQSQSFTPGGNAHGTGSILGSGSGNNSGLIQGAGGPNGNNSSRFSNMMPHTAMPSQLTFDSSITNGTGSSQFHQHPQFMQPMSATSYSFPHHSQHHSHNINKSSQSSVSGVSTPTTSSSNARGLLGSHNNSSHSQNNNNRLHLFNSGNDFFQQQLGGSSNIGRNSIPNTPQTPMMNGNPAGTSIVGATPSAVGASASSSSGNGLLLSTPTMSHHHNNHHHHHQQQHTNNGNNLDNGLLLVNNHIVTSPELRAMYRSANKYFCVDKVEQVYQAIKTLLDPMAPYAPKVTALINFLKKKNDIGNYTIFSGGSTGNITSSGNGSPSRNTSVSDFGISGSAGNGKYKLLSLVCSKSGKIDVLTISPNSNLLLQKHDLVIVEGDRGKDLVHVVEPTVGLNFVILLNFLKKREHLKSMGAGPSIVNTSASSPHHHHHHHHHHYGNTPGLVYAQDDESVVSLPTKQILRFASSHEVSQLPGKLKNEIVAFKIALEKLNQLNVKSSSPLSSTSPSVASSDSTSHHSHLNLRIFNSEYQFDKKKLIFYYSCAKRNDFRDLIKELFKIYKTRIWLSAVLNPDEFSPYSEGNVASRSLLQNNLKSQVALSSLSPVTQERDDKNDTGEGTVSEKEVKYMFNNADDDVKRQKYEDRINTILKIDENGNAIDFGFEDIVVDDFHAQNLINSIKTLKIDLNIQE